MQLSRKDQQIKGDRTSYLPFDMEVLSQEKGSLITFGVSFDNDDHIREAILKNTGLTSIYFGCYGFRTGNDFFKIQARIAETCHRIKVDLSSMGKRLNFYNSRLFHFFDLCTYKQSDDYREATTAQSKSFLT